MKITVLLLLMVVLTPACLYLTLQLPPVQQLLINTISKRISQRTGFTLTIDDVYIQWLDKANFSGVKIVDPDSNTMLNSKNIRIDLDIWNLLSGEVIEEDLIQLDSVDLLLRPLIVDDSNRILNVSLFIQRLRNPNAVKTGQVKPIILHKVIITSGSLAIDDPQKNKLAQGLDLNHLKLKNLNTEWTELKVENNIITANIESLIAEESQIEIPINELSSKFYYDSASIRLHGLNLAIGKSTIKDTLEILYGKPENFKYFQDSVDLHIKFDRSVIYQSDIAKLVPPGNYIPYRMNLSGTFNGVISRFQLEDYLITFGNSRLAGTAGFSGLPNINETFLNLRFENSRIEPRDIQDLIKLDNKLLTDLGMLGLNGRFIGYPNDFVAFAEFETKNGKINSDLNLKLPDDGEPTYTGRLQLHNFNMGNYLSDSQVGYVDFLGSITGTSFNPDLIKMNVTGDFRLLEYNNYSYRNIYADGQVASNFYKGYLRINDPNLQFELDGTVDLNEDKEQITMMSILNHISLKPLGLSESEIIARTTAELDFRGLTIDEIVGSMLFQNLEIQVDQEYMRLDSASLQSSFDTDSIKTLRVESDLADLSISGKYKLASVYKNLGKLFQIHWKILSDPGLEDDSVKLEIFSDPSYLNYTLDIHDVAPLLKLLKEDITISDKAEFKGDFTTGRSTTFSMFTNIDTLIVGDYTFIDNLMELNLSGGEDSLSTAGTLIVESKNQNLAGIQSEDILMELNLEDLRLNFDISARQQKFDNLLNLKGDIDFGKNSTKIKLNSSELDLLGRPWQIDPLAELIFSDDAIRIKDVIISNEYQGLAVEGAVSRDSTEQLTIQFESLGLQNINSIINKDLYGFLNGYMIISNLYGNTRIENDLSILDMTINDFPVGNVFGKVLWDKDNKEFDLDFTVLYQQVLTMNLKGYYKPNIEEPLFIDAELVNAPINLLEPWIENFFSNLKGTATGKFQIRGNTLSPRVFGNGKLEGGSFRVNYLMVDYFLQGAFSFSEDVIFLDNITMNDRFGNGGKLTGSINHGGFRSMAIDLSANFNRIQVLNTSGQDNNLFYGQGFGSGNITFKGPVNNLNIVANARTERGTRIFIPIGGIEEIDTRDFINFTSFSDTVTFEQKEIEEIDLKGVTLDLNIDVTNDAYAEIIFDIKAGDIIRGRGNGDLNLRIDTNGEFNMFGPLNIEEGWYNFTLYNLINKEFTIYPGGRITWYGDPYEGVMDLTASYRQPASIAPILDPLYSETSDVKRQYPTEVVMGLTGPLLSPDIKFDIKAEQLPRNVTLLPPASGSVDMSLEFESFINRIDEQELKRQVFSLIVLKKFSPPEEFNTGGVISNSVSELFSNQLSYWMSQVDENLEIDFDVDLTSFDQEAFNTFQMRLSYSFFDGRLRLTRDGTFINQNDEVDLNSLAGNWSVEYLITQDGRVKARVYNRNNYDNLNYSERNNNTTGISLQYTQSFNEFFAEMGKAFKSNKKRKEDKPTEDPQGPNENGVLKDEELNDF